MYPLELFSDHFPYPAATVDEIFERFIDSRGFFHPIIHSGYNPYLTLQTAHALMMIGKSEQARNAAMGMFMQAAPTGVFPEAIHPATKGGSMGDGHHGWAAAEAVLFIRSCLVRERENRLESFHSGGPLLMADKSFAIECLPTLYAVLNCHLRIGSRTNATMEISLHGKVGPVVSQMDIQLPFTVKRLRSVPHTFVSEWEALSDRTTIKCNNAEGSLLLDL